MNKVLLIAYYFPPIAGSGAFRPTKFVKHLPDFGWLPYVITTDRPYTWHGWDETLVCEIPSDVEVWRVATPRPRPVDRLARWVGWKAADEPSPRLWSLVEQGLLWEP